MPAVHLLISGRVQMVGYRAWCQRVALDLALLGWVRNLEDGRVEVFAQGESADLETLCERCWQGPPHAAVADVVRSERAPRAFAAFTHAPDAVGPDRSDDQVSKP